ncbi:MAG: hypothetical protein ACREJN_18095, partial [Nitrospiraceae bacterium]
ARKGGVLYSSRFVLNYLQASQRHARTRSNLIEFDSSATLWPHYLEGDDYSSKALLNKRRDGLPDAQQAGRCANGSLETFEDRHTDRCISLLSWESSLFRDEGQLIDRVILLTC